MGFKPGKIFKKVGFVAVGAVAGFVVGGPVGAVAGGAAGFALASGGKPGSAPFPDASAAAEQAVRKKAAETERKKKRRRRTQRIFTSPQGALVDQTGGKGRLFGGP